MPRHRHRRRHRDQHGCGGGPGRPVDSGRAQQFGVAAFDLFCAYHLGITADGGYQFQNVHQVAKRFGTNAGVIRQLLTDLRMDADAVVHSSFDLASAQVDIMLAPEGISRVELAKGLYEEFLAAPRRDRNWTKELADDARANERVFGREGGGRGGQ